MVHKCRLKHDLASFTTYRSEISDPSHEDAVVQCPIALSPSESRSFLSLSEALSTSKCLRCSPPMVSSVRDDRLQAKAGGLLRKAMLAEGQLQTTFDALSSGRHLENDNVSALFVGLSST